MSADSGAGRDQGATTWSGGDGPDRPRHALVGPLMRFDVADELDRLRDEPEYRKQDRNAKTLVKVDSFRMVLVALKAGARFDEAQPRGSVGIAVREGRVAIGSEGDRCEVGPGEVVALTTGHRWSAEALDESVLVLTLSWPPEAADRG